eukprot:1534222-Amphidinium_carterae.1
MSDKGSAMYMCVYNQKRNTDALKGEPSNKPMRFTRHVPKTIKAFNNTLHQGKMKAMTVVEAQDHPGPHT